MHVKSAKGELDTVPGTERGFPIFTRRYSYVVAITPAGTVLPEGHCDGLMVSANANVTMTSPDAPEATPFVLALIAGTQYDIGAAKVTAVSAGTAYALYHRKPSLIA